MTNSGASAKPSVFSHWACAAAVLLVVSSLTIYQIDLVPPSFDEWLTISSTAIAEPGSLADFLTWHQLAHPSNMPGYYILLTVWSKLTSPDVAILRTLGVFLSLLHAALVYRMARDFIAPVAGLFAVVIVVSNAFFNFYIAHARPYALFALLSCVTIWLYLRIIHGRRSPGARELVSLGLAVFALVMTHLFCATLLFSLGLYHLFIVPKSRRWLAVGLVIGIAVLLCLPMAAFVLSGYSTSISHLQDSANNGFEAVELWLSVVLNGQTWPLLLLTVAGLVLGIRQGLIGYQAWFALPALFLVTIAFLGQFSDLITPTTMRHQLDGWVLFVLCAAASLYAFFRWKRWLGFLALLWLISGYTFQHSANWWNIIAYRAASFWLPPTQVLARSAHDHAPTPYILSYPTFELYHQSLIQTAISGLHATASPRDYYFSRGGVAIGLAKNIDEFDKLLQEYALNSPTVWHIYQKPFAHAEELSAAAEAMRRRHYQLCGVENIGLATVLNYYAWELFDCQPPTNPALNHTELIDFEFYKAASGSEAENVVFISRWTPRRDFDRRDYNLSFQLISEGWNNVAQLDLPLVAEGQLRQYTIEVSRIPSGTYRLMLILYRASTGDRLPWDGNSGYVPEMLELAEIELDAS